MRAITTRLLATLSIAGIIGFFFLFPYINIVKEYIGLKMAGKKTVAERLAEYGSVVENRLAPTFRSKNVPYPPHEMVFLVFKQEKIFEVYAKSQNEKYTLINTYPIIAASGNLGPKLREGDRQVPEGIYRIESLNPNSLYHLSMKVSYPNDFDKKMAHADHRTNLGGDIMIHGNQVSIGCIAMGDEVSENLFVLAGLVGCEKIKVVISPVDFRKTSMSIDTLNIPSWTIPLYQEIKNELIHYDADA